MDVAIGKHQGSSLYAQRGRIPDQPQDKGLHCFAYMVCCCGSVAGLQTEYMVEKRCLDGRLRTRPGSIPADLDLSSTGDWIVECQTAEKLARHTLETIPKADVLALVRN